MRVQIPPRAFVLAFFAAVQFLYLPGSYLGSEHDDAHYVLAAQSLTRGHYKLETVPGTPPFAFITPGFPALLVPAALLFGDHWRLYHYYAWLWLVLADVLLWLWLKDKLKPVEALALTAAFALNPLVLARAGALMTETPALALTLLAFLLLERGRPAWLLGCLVGLLWLVRQPSVALIAAAAFVYAWPRRWKDLAAFAAGPLAAIAGWHVWLARYGESMTDFDELRSAYQNSRELLAIPASNVEYYCRLWGASWIGVSGAAAVAVGAALFLLSGWGWRRLARLSPLAALWLAWGGLMHVLWPWQYERYLLSFIPMLLLSAWEGAQAIGAAARLRGLLALLLLQFFAAGLPAARARQSVPELQPAYDWINAHVPPGQAVASFLYDRDALYLEHPVAPIPGAAEPGLAAGLRSARIPYVLAERLSDVGSTIHGRYPTVREMQAVWRELELPPFMKVFQDPANGSAVFRLAGAEARPRSRDSSH